MNALIDALLDLDLLQRHRLVRGVRIISYDRTPSGKLELKIRCRLARGYHLQVWLHHEPAFKDYAYQFFTDHPLLRWDNAPHFPRISTAPHHFHGETGQVEASPLCGDPVQDLRYVLAEIGKWLSESSHTSK